MWFIYILLFLYSNLVFAFNPICSNPENVSLTDVKNILKDEKNNKFNQLIIYSVNPPTPIDWSTPGSTFKSIFRNSFIKESYKIEDLSNNDNFSSTKKQFVKTHFIGHMFMELKCEGFPTILTGMSSPGYEEIKGLLVDGRSFEQVISTTEGHFNTAKELQDEIETRKTRVGNLSIMGINLKHDSCEELLKYLTEFRACGVNTRYGGLNANPHKSEGAGCSAFALSFLQRLNIVPMIDEIGSNDFGSQFLRTVYVPRHLLKFQNKDPEVGAWGLLRGLELSWANQKNAEKVVTFFDPELFSKWIKEFNIATNISGLRYLGRDGNKLINSIWFEEENNNIESSQFSIDYLKINN
jgi:hypothetical protein